MPTLLLGDMKKLQGRDSFSTWKVQMNASLQSQGLWFTVEPGIDYFKDILEHGMMLEARVQQLKDDERPEAGEARQKLAEVLEGFKAFHARSKEEGKHGEEVVLSRSRVGDVKVTPLKGFSKSHYKTCDGPCLFGVEKRIVCG